MPCLAGDVSSARMRRTSCGSCQLNVFSSLYLYSCYSYDVHPHTYGYPVQNDTNWLRIDANASIDFYVFVNGVLSLSLHSLSFSLA